MNQTSGWRGEVQRREQEKALRIRTAEVERAEAELAEARKLRLREKLAFLVEWFLVGLLFWTAEKIVEAVL